MIPSSNSNKVPNDAVTGTSLVEKDQEGRFQGTPVKKVEVESKIPVSKLGLSDKNLKYLADYKITRSDKVKTYLLDALAGIGAVLTGASGLAAAAALGAGAVLTTLAVPALGFVIWPMWLLPIMFGAAGVMGAGTVAASRADGHTHWREGINFEKVQGAIKKLQEQEQEMVRDYNRALFKIDGLAGEPLQSLVINQDMENAQDRLSHLTAIRNRLDSEAFQGNHGIKLQAEKLDEVLKKEREINQLELCIELKETVEALGRDYGQFMIDAQTFVEDHMTRLVVAEQEFKEPGEKWKFIETNAGELAKNNSRYKQLGALAESIAQNKARKEHLLRELSGMGQEPDQE